MKIHTVFVQIRAPKNGDQGRVAEGNYTFEDGAVTLTDRAGVPATDEHGRKYTQKLDAGEHHRTIAGRLTRKLREELRGANAPKAGFDGPIQYNKPGWR
jgi:hypothetical protein